jgi:hypothetical protein
VLLAAIPLLFLTRRLASPIWTVWKVLTRLVLVQEAGARWQVDSAEMILGEHVPNPRIARDVLSLRG